MTAKMVSPEAEPMSWNVAENDSLVDGGDSAETDVKSVLEMAPLDPVKILKGLSDHLGVNGEIKNVEEVQKLLPMMRDAKKLVSRCVFINILKATESKELYEKFIDDGGWDLLNVWLQDAKSDENTPFLIEILHLYQKMPVSKFSVDLLKSNNCAKTIKGLCKAAETDEIKVISNEIVERWMNRIREIREMDAAEAENSGDTKKKKKRRSEQKAGEENGEVKNEEDEKLRIIKIKDLKDKIKEENDKLDKHKHRHHHHHHHHKSSSKDKDHRRRSSDTDSKHRNGDKGDKSDKHRHSDKRKHDDKHRHHDNKKKDGSSSRRRDNKDSDSSTKNSDGSTVKKEKTDSSVKKEDSKKVDSPSSLKKRTSDHFASNDTKSKVLKTSSLKDVKGRNSDRKEVKDRPKTVKPFTTKFRDTGLIDQAAVPAKRKDEGEREKLKLVIKKTPSGSSMVTTSTSSSSISDASTSGSSTSTSSPSANTSIAKPMERKPRPVLPAPVVRSNSQDSNKSPTESPGKIKLIPPQKRPKAYELADSSDFMKALIAPPPPVPMKKKRKTSIGGPVKQPTTPTSPPTPTRNVPSFYKDTLEGNDEKEKMGESTDFPMSESEQAKRASDANTGGGDASSVTDTESVSSQSSSNNNGKKKKKKVSWRDDKYLRVTHYFELDETERVNVNKQNFEDMKKQEMATERHGLERAKIISADRMAEKMMWRRPSLISNLQPRTTDHGARSTERDVQRTREQGVLQAIFFSKDMIPDTPMEPDQETTDVEEPRIIPLEDESTGEDAYVPTDDSAPQQQKQYDSATFDNQLGADQQNAAQTTGAEQPQASLPPEIASLLGQISSQVQAQNQPPGGITTTADVTATTPAADVTASLPPQITGIIESLTQTAQLQPLGGPVDPNAGAAPDPNSILTSVQSLLTNFMGQNTNPETPNQDQAQHDFLTEKLKQILEPFQKQLQGTMVPPPGPAGMMMPPGPAPFPMPMPPPVGPDGQILPPPPGIRLPPGVMIPGAAGPGVAMGMRPPMGVRPPFPGVGLPAPGPGMPSDNFNNQRFQGPMRGGRGGNFQMRGNRGGPMGGLPHRGFNRGRGRGGGGDRSSNICRHFQSVAGCFKGDKCSYLHVKTT